MKFDIPEPAVGQNNYTIELCDDVLYNMPRRPEIRHERNDAFYHPMEDYINMPRI
ncbi:MAG: hypothetical protein U5K79_07275 [Cyclobacteriaceae bacterium]|nr:hypothetical protein [Cyclobacteriaceae bacterium]